MNSTIRWDVKSCSLVEVNLYFGGTKCYHLEGGRVSQAQSKQEAEFG